MPSSIYVEKKYSLKLLEYLKAKGEVVYRKIYEADKYSDIITTICSPNWHFNSSCPTTQGGDLKNLPKYVTFLLAVMIPMDASCYYAIVKYAQTEVDVKEGDEISLDFKCGSPEFIDEVIAENSESHLAMFKYRLESIAHHEGRRHDSHRGPTLLGRLAERVEGGNTDVR